MPTPVEPIDTVAHSNAAQEPLTVAEQIGDWLYEYRVRENITQAELARRLGWKQSVVARLERGDHAPRVETLESISTLLGVRIIITVEPRGLTEVRFVRPRTTS